MRHFLTMMVLIVAGCGGINLDTKDYPKQAPKTADLVGEYRPTPETLASIKGEGGYPDREISIVLDADGSLRIANIPDWWRSSHGEPSGDFVSGSGKWEVAASQGWYQLDLELSSMNLEIARKDLGGLATEATLVGDRPPYQIRLYVGDPDSSRAMTFHKLPAKEPK